MKIGITCHPTYGGSGVVATEIGLELAQLGHEVHFITYANPIRLADETPRVFYHEVEVTSYPLFQYPPYSLALATRMREVADRVGLDLLHVHYAIPHSVSALLASQMAGRRLPFITTLHGTDVTLVGSDPSYLPVTRFAIENSPAVTCISEYLREETLRVFGVSKRIEVIPNFVNGDIYRRQQDWPLRARFARRREKLVAHLSNFRPVKRVLDCIRVFERLAERFPCRLLMIGDGPDREPAERLASDLGVRARVRFLGERRDVASLLGVTDLLLLPSEMESFGLVALEAMACGAVPIATRVGGLPEVVTDGHDGFLVPAGDIGAMARAAESVCLDSARERSMRAAGRQTAVARFSSNAVIATYVSLYERTLEDSQSR